MWVYVVLLFWGRAVSWPLADSVVVDWALSLVGGVGGMSVIGLASGWLVGGLLEGEWAVYYNIKKNTWISWIHPMRVLAAYGSSDRRISNNINGKTENKTK